MTTKPLFQHRHYVAIAAIVAQWPEPARDVLAAMFAAEFAADNPRFDESRFLAAADGKPATKRDKPAINNAASLFVEHLHKMNGR